MPIVDSIGLAEDGVSPLGKAAIHPRRVGVATAGRVGEIANAGGSAECAAEFTRHLGSGNETFRDISDAIAWRAGLSWVNLDAEQRAKGEAVDQLIASIKRDRKWNDDGARKQLVQLFDAWGPTDEATVAGRKRLSSILFS